MRTWICAGTKDRKPCGYSTEQPDLGFAVAHLCGSGRRRTDMWSPSFATEAIAAESIARFPEEACGFVLSDGTVVKCKNAAEDANNNFLIPQKDAEKWWATGRVFAVWHSHCFGSIVPSENDERFAGAAHEIEHWIYSVMDEDLGAYVVEDEKLKLRTVYEGSRL